ncbi:hypothetical protein BWZ20_07995 [Winogradskyella sp. J14-2]|nr:hypothetical protein BWZ20_07995 [Winogradskyella sp. J14-2]
MGQIDFFRSVPFFVHLQSLVNTGNFEQYRVDIGGSNFVFLKLKLFWEHRTDELSFELYITVNEILIKGFEFFKPFFIGVQNLFEFVQ